MKNLTRRIDIFLDSLKTVLVRFRKAKFGIGFIINVFKIPDFITDRRVNVISKFKLVFVLGIALIYMILGIDFIPELITGIFGFIDDVFVITWALGIANEEIEKYRDMIKDKNDPNIIDGVDYTIRDEKE